jgi:Putative Flp pilus-assembly TadE/G-like
MRRLDQISSGDNKNETGAVAPLFAIALVALLGFTALAVDVGTMYSEKAQLQNGADSAALAIAQTCAKVALSSPCATDQSAAATPFANGNAVDGTTGVKLATVNAGVVDVTTETPAGSGGEHFSLALARVLGNNAVEIQATARAEFGGIGSADVVAMTFSICETDPLFAKGIQFFPTHGKKMTETYACKLDNGGQPTSSGKEIPGGFGWLADPANDCKVLVDVAKPVVISDPGNDLKKSCEPTFTGWAESLAAGNTVTALVPIFKAAGAKDFTVVAFAQLRIRGWVLSGSNTKLPGSYNVAPSLNAIKTTDPSFALDGNDRGLFAEFVKKVAIEDVVSLGGPTTYGAPGIRLTK